MPLSVLVVGAGFGGLSAAISCRRQGMDVTLLERLISGVSPYGDAIGFGANAVKVLYRWDIGDDMYKISAKGDLHGKILVQEDNRNIAIEFGAPICPGHRAEFQRIWFNKAKEIGVKILTGVRVEQYFDGEDGIPGSRPWVITKRGDRIEADVILAADGIKSRAKEVVLDFPDAPQSSGYAAYRAAMPIKELMEDPACRHLIDETGRAWIGPDVHAVAASFNGSCSFAVTHKEEGSENAAENWNKPCKADDVLKHIEGWDPALRALIGHFKECLDWKLCFRDPLPTWISKNGKIALLGDGAHPFLPTSIQGAGQAFEDGATLGIVLALAGAKAESVPLALKIFEKLRFERVRVAQKSGEMQRKNWHDSADKDKEDLKLSTRDFYDHDAEEHALTNFQQVAESIDPGFSLDSNLWQTVVEATDLEKCRRGNGPLSPEGLKRFFRDAHSEAPKF
ncbi:FAD/NAD-P-binding domain-containing protein [Atractiella rhizophila]|nr:FAD/NAD-P-binding domain-containing protein [Atractiella rhizophila]